MIFAQFVLIAWIVFLVVWGLIVYVGRCKQPGMRTPPEPILDRCGICKRPLDEPVEGSIFWRCPSCLLRVRER